MGVSQGYKNGLPCVPTRGVDASNVITAAMDCKRAQTLVFLSDIIQAALVCAYFER